MICSVHQSIVFQNNCFENLFSDLFVNYGLQIIIVINNFGSYLLSHEKNLIIQGILLIFFGIQLFSSSLNQFNFHNQISSIRFLFSIGTILFGLVGIYHVTFHIENPQIVIINLLFALLAIFFILVFISNKLKKKVCDEFQRLDPKNPDFDSLPIQNDNQAISYLRVAFEEAYPFVCNGSMIHWMLKKFDSEIVDCALLIVTSLVPISKDEMTNFLDKILMQNNKSFKLKFILFRHYIILSLQAITQVSFQFKPIISELKTRITQFQTIISCFIRNISEDFETNFLLMDSLAEMKYVLFHNLKYLIEIYPNSPETLLLYQTYESKIEYNQVKSHKYTELINELSNGSILFRSFGYVQTFSSYPKIQRALYGRYSQNPNDKMFLSSNMKIKKYQKNFASTDSYQLINQAEDLTTFDDIFHHFHSKSETLILIINILFAFLGLSILFSTFGVFYNANNLHSLFSKESDFIISYKNCLEAYFTIYFRPLMLFSLYNGYDTEISANSNFSDPFISSQIKMVYNENNNLRYRAAEFRNKFNNLALNYPLFSNNFNFLTRSMFIIPSFYHGVGMNSTIRVFFTRFSSSLYPFFRNENTFYPNYSDKIKQVYINSIQVEQPVIDDIIRNLAKSVELFLKDCLKTLNNTFIIFIYPYLLIAGLLSIIPYFYIRIFKKSMKRLQIEKTSRNKQTLSNLLGSKFYTLKKYFIVYYSYLLILLIILLIDILSHKIPLQYFVKTKFINLNYYASNDVNTYYYATTPLTLLYLANMSIINLTSKKDLIYECFNYFTNSTTSGLSVDFSRTNFEMYEYLIQTMNILERKDIIITKKESDDFIKLLDNSLFKQLKGKALQTTLKYKSDEKYFFNNIPICFSFITFVASLLILLSFRNKLNRLIRSLRAHLHFIHYYQINNNNLTRQRIINSSPSFDIENQNVSKKISNSSGNDMKEDEKAHQNSSFIIPNGKFVYSISNILDFINKPCCLIDRTNDIITTVNTLWLKFFNCTPEFSIGRPYTDFQLSGMKNRRLTFELPLEKTRDFDHDLKFTICGSFSLDIPFFENMSFNNLSILLIDEIPIDEEMNQKISQLQSGIINKRNNHYPRRFINRSAEGVEKIGFNVAVSLMLVPNSKEDVSPDLWVKDTDSFEAWITERCKESDNIDILNRSKRELTIYFGIEKEEEKQFLVLQALNIACDILRWGLERNWENKSGVQIFLIVTCGDFAEFVFKRQNSALIQSVFGPSSEKEMILREKIKANSIIIDPQVVDNMGPYKNEFMTKFFDNDYIFTLNNDHYIFTVNNTEENQEDI